MSDVDRSADHRDLERHLHQLAAGFPYPGTPPLSVPLEPRRAAPIPRLAGALALALILVLVAVPPVRAAVGEMLRVGVVRIFQGVSESAPSPDQAMVPPGALTVLDLPGETDLATARQAVAFELRIPADLGPPDRVFLLQGAGPAVAMVWLDPNQPEVPQAALYTFPSDSVARKLMPQTVEQVQVSGQDGVWTSGAHYFELPLGGQSLRLYVPGGVLIWTEGPLTYRLETTEPLERALEIAESLP